MAAGTGNENENQAEEYNAQFDKAIAFNPEDPVFKVKKSIIFSCTIKGLLFSSKYKFFFSDFPTLDGW
jgi:hypothetical protein